MPILKILSYELESVRGYLLSVYNISDVLSENITRNWLHNSESGTVVMCVDCLFTNNITTSNS